MVAHHHNKPVKPTQEDIAPATTATAIILINIMKSTNAKYPIIP